MKIKLTDFPTFNKEWDKEKIKAKTEKILERIGELQHKMYAENKHSLLIVLQGMDASGKDGVTKGLLKYCNPVGFSTFSFRKPTDEECAHDFLWRVHKQVPGKGETMVFIRSHYEDILVPSVGKYIASDTIARRYKIINEFELLLEQNNTKVLKFYLHVSMDAQKERLMERIEQKEKHWKHKDSDWDTREKFDEYTEVYEKILNTCNEIPWHIVPADKNWQKLYAVAVEVVKTLEMMYLKWPDLVTERFNPETTKKQIL